MALLYRGKGWGYSPFGLNKTPLHNCVK